MSNYNRRYGGRTYNKRYQGGRGYRRYNNYNKNRGIGQSKMWNEINKLKEKTGSPEWNTFDVAIALTPVAGTSILTPMNDMAVGDTHNTRDGNKINIRSFQLNLTIKINSGDLSTVCRVMVVIDKQASGSIMSIAGTGGLLELDAVTSLRNDRTMKRFVVLCDKFCALSITGKQMEECRCYKKMKMNTQYDATAAGIGSVQTNSLILILMTTSVATDEPTITGLSRIKWTDM